MSTMITVAVPEAARGDELGRHDDRSMCWVQGLPHGVTLEVEQVSRGNLSGRVVARVSAADESGRRTVRSIGGDELGVITLANRSVGSYAAWSLGDDGYELAGADWWQLIGAVSAILGLPGCLRGYYRFAAREV